MHVARAQGEKLSEVKVLLVELAHRAFVRDERAVPLTREADAHALPAFARRRELDARLDPEGGGGKAGGGKTGGWKVQRRG